MVLTLSVAGCSGDNSATKELTRPLAMRVMQQTNLSIQNIQLTKVKEGEACLRQVGVLGDPNRNSMISFFSNTVLTTYGRSFIKGWNDNEGLAIEFSPPMPMDVDRVTGITDGVTVRAATPASSQKQVEFVGKLNVAKLGLNPDVSSCLMPSGTVTGTAVMALYDDGWRLQSFQINPV
ncbi:MAG TPA: hypothetical protein VL358_06555 [Caulobacteraceae bacterium]|nr:hypothetical protein [Caulobacteraceae bacterium]